MKRLVIPFVAAIFVVTSAASSYWAGGAGGALVTGAGDGVFPSGAEYAGVRLSGSTFGQGVVVTPGGAASGDFFMVLLGTDAATGLARSITLSGVATSGEANGASSVTFGGNSMVNLGDGTAPVLLPFMVTATAGGLTLVLGATALPTQSLTFGGIDIDPL